jgi:hypothetical protein
VTSKQKLPSVAIREGKNFNLDRWYRFAFSRIDNAGGCDSQKALHPERA